MLQLCAFATLVCSIITVDYVQDNLPSSIPRAGNVIIEGLIGLNYNTLIRNTEAAASIGIAIACIGLVYEITWVVIRFINVGFMNSWIKIFLGIVS